MLLIDHTIAGSGLTAINELSTDGTFEKAGTSVAGENAVMFAARKIAANHAQQVLGNVSKFRITVRTCRISVTVLFQLNHCRNLGLGVNIVRETVRTFGSILNVQTIL